LAGCSSGACYWEAVAADPAVVVGSAAVVEGSEASAAAVQAVAEPVEVGK